MRWVDSHTTNKNVYSLCLNVSTEMSGARRSAGRLPCPKSLYLFTPSLTRNVPDHKGVKTGSVWNTQVFAIYGYVIRNQCGWGPLTFIGAQGIGRAFTKCGAIISEMVHARYRCVYMCNKIKKTMR